MSARRSRLNGHHAGLPLGHSIDAVAAAESPRQGDVVVWTMRMDPLTAECVLRPDHGQLRVTLCGTLLYVQDHDDVDAALSEGEAMRQRLQHAGWL